MDSTEALTLEATYEKLKRSNSKSQRSTPSRKRAERKEI
jgi:hypothetical protein